MVHLNTQIYNNCYSTLWVALDCEEFCIMLLGISHVASLNGVGFIYQTKLWSRVDITRRSGSSDFLQLSTGNFIRSLKMSSSTSSGSRTQRRAFEYGRTHVVKPKGKHQATIVWLHGLGDNGSSWSQLLEALPLPNIKWICPTAPNRPISLFGGFPSNAWFDVNDLSEDAPADLEGLDSAAAHVANLLSTEPAEIKLGIGGFSMGAATALYSATCFAHGKYSNGDPYPVNISGVVGLSGWLPCARVLKNKLQASEQAMRKAQSLPVLLCHGKADDVVMYTHGEKSAQVMQSAGFSDMLFKSYKGMGHYTVPEETDEVCRWLSAKLGLDGA